MGVGGQRHAPAALPPGKTRYPLYKRLGGPQDRSERVWKISPPTRIRSTDRPVRSESLYRLSLPGSQVNFKLTVMQHVSLGVGLLYGYLITQKVVRRSYMGKMGAGTPFAFTSLSEGMVTNIYYKF